VRKETQDRPGKTPGQPAHTREVKLGCVFTQTQYDDQGYAIRDPQSTTYTGAIESAEQFGKRIFLEAWKRGWSHALIKVVLGDGAEWIWKLVDLHFPGAIQIVDLFHARQHLWDLARALYAHTGLCRNAGSCANRACWTVARSRSWYALSELSRPPPLNCWRPFVSKPTTLKRTRNACAIRSFAANT